MSEVATQPMPVASPDVWARLCAPFDPSEIKSKPMGAGQKADYVTARTVMNRLDEVFGPANWQDKYVDHETHVLCQLSIRVGNEWITKEDVGGHAGMQDEGDNEKSGYSDAFKRAAAKWGAGRHLYKDGIPRYGSSKPMGFANAGSAPAASAKSTETTKPAKSEKPADGRAFFKWIMAKTQIETDLLKKVNNWAQRKGFPVRIVDWSVEQVAEAYEKISSRESQPKQQSLPDNLPIDLSVKLAKEHINQAKANLKSQFGEAWAAVSRSVAVCAQGERLIVDSLDLQAANFETILQVVIQAQQKWPDKINDLFSACQIKPE